MTSPSHTPRPWGGGSVLTLLLLVAAGVVGNLCKFTLFYNADLVFGSIFSMWALQRFGLGRGTAAAALISLPLIFLWGHPYGMAIMTAEVAGVGWLALKRNVGWVQADAIFWLVLGMPLVYGCYHLGMKTPSESTLFLMAKDMVNGIMNILVARFLFIGLSRRGGLSRVSYREIMFDLLVFFVVAPGLVMIAVASRRDLAEINRQIRTGLIRDGRQITNMVTTWVGNRQAVVSHLAAMATGTSTAAMQRSLEQAAESDRNFLRVGLLDRDGTITVHHPLLDELGQPYIGNNYADRPFIPIMKKTLKPVLSEVVMSRLGVPMVALVAPAVRRGEYRGYVIGVLALDQIRENLQLTVDERGTRYLLLDGKGRIITTNRSDQNVMGPLVRGPGTLQRVDDQISQWLPAAQAHAPAMIRWGNSFHVAEFPIGGEGGWTLVLEQPMAPFQRRFFLTYAQELAVLLLLVLAALAFAEAISRRLSQGLEHLAVITRDLPATLATEGARIHWPDPDLRETDDLATNFRIMAETLAEQFHQARQAHERLEARVRERTRELEDREARYLALFQLSPDGISISRLSDGVLLGVNAAWHTMFGFTAEEIRGQSTATLGLYAEPEARAALYRQFPGTGLVPAFTLNLLRKGGAPFVAELTGRVMAFDGEPCLLAVLRDATREVAMRSQALAGEVRTRKAESLVLMAGSIAHDFNNLFQALMAMMEIAEVKSRALPEVLGPITRAKGVLHKAIALSWKMLDFSGRAIARPVTVHLEDLVASWAQGLAPRLGETRLDLDLAPVPTVKADPKKFLKVLDDFLDNALEAMTEAGVREGAVRVGLHVAFSQPGSHAPGQWVADPPRVPASVCLTFSNDGPVPPPEVMARMFDPFFTTRELGRGLGLPSALGLLQAHGAGLHLSADATRGLRLRIYFPPAGA